MNAVQRRVAGYHDLRLDGISDLVNRAKGASVLDIGCNRGLVAFEMANNGAQIVHGCDNYADGIRTAREIFADIRNVQSQFEVVDLTKGFMALRPLAIEGWDIVLMLATYHKLKRVMEAGALTELMANIGSRTKQFFGWRGPGIVAESNAEMAALDRDLGDVGLKRIHTSYLSKEIGPAAIWARG